MNDDVKDTLRTFKTFINITLVKEDHKRDRHKFNWIYVIRPYFIDCYLLIEQGNLSTVNFI